MSTQLERDTRAAVEFLAADAWRFFHALHAHVPGEDGLCVAHNRPHQHPCSIHRMASFAELLYRDRLADTMPIPRIPPDQP